MRYHLLRLQMFTADITILIIFNTLYIIGYSNEKSELKKQLKYRGYPYHIFRLDTFIWLVGQFYPCKAHSRFAICHVGFVSVTSNIETL